MFLSIYFSFIVFSIITAFKTNPNTVTNLSKLYNYYCVAFLLGLKQYVQDGFNTFDAVVVLASWAEIAFAPPRFITGSSEAGESALSALRTFRLFRVFKLARSWSDLRIILETIVKTLEDVSNFAILLGKYSKRRCEQM